MIHAVGAVPIEVPVYEGLRAGQTLQAIVEPYLSAKTAALYVTSPNNPCGTVLTPQQAQAVAQLANDRDLWVIADEAYHDFVYGDGSHTFVANLPGMAERTATVLTASKSFALAGTRVGFLVGRGPWMDAARRVATHQLYQVPIVGQVAALRAIETGEAWIAETRDLYAEAADVTARTLQAKFAPAAGGGYVFIDVRQELGDLTMIDYLRGLLHEGVCISPGDVFGADYGGWARVCYTAVPLDQLHTGIARLNRSLERLRAGQPIGQ
jgi:N-succinyldiaminopimelate aminotransferase